MNDNKLTSAPMFPTCDSNGKISNIEINSHTILSDLDFLSDTEKEIFITRLLILWNAARQQKTINAAKKLTE